MIQSEILNKNDICYFLLSSYNEPNILIPAKGLIIDIKYDYDEPQYLIKLEHVYDNIGYIRRHIYNMFFYTDFKQTHKVRLNLKKVTTTKDFNSQLFNGDFKVVIHSLMTTDSIERLRDLFDKLNYYFISLSIYNLKNYLTRPFYSGFLKLSPVEFDSRFIKIIYDLFDGQQISLKQFMSDINQTKPIHSLKYEKLKKYKYKKP